MNRPSYKWLMVCLLLLTMTACSSPSEKQEVQEVTMEATTRETQVTIEEEPTQSNQELLVGETKEGFYLNRTFDMAIELPEEWLVLSDEEMVDMLGQGEAMLSDDQVEALEPIEVWQLLVSLKYPLEEQVLVNPSFVMTAERVDDREAMVTGETYLQASKEVLLTLGLEVDLDDPVTKSSPGGLNYGELHGTIEVGDTRVEQGYVAFRVDEYMISCVMTYAQDDLDSRAILNRMMAQVLER